MSTDETEVEMERIRLAKCSQCGGLMDLGGVELFADILCPHCGAEKRVPGRLGKYLILDFIGKGGGGAVYRGVDSELDRPVAIKVMLKSAAQTPQLQEQFRTEALAAARISHAHVAFVYEFGFARGQPYIVMEHVEGTSLKKLIQEGPPMDQALALKLGIEVAGGLNAAGKVGLIHGDVKPENILLNSHFEAKLIDFGLASFVESVEQATAIWGSPYYIAPERLRRTKADARSDMYSLGGTLYHALTGHPPFDGDTVNEVALARLEGAPKHIRSWRPGLGMKLGGLVMRMLEKEPEQRHPDYKSLIADMRGAMKEVLSLPKRVGGTPGRRTIDHALRETGVQRLLMTPEREAANLKATTMVITVVPENRSVKSGAAPQAIRKRTSGGPRAAAGLGTGKEVRAAREARKPARRDEKMLPALVAGVEGPSPEARPSREGQKRSPSLGPIVLLVALLATLLFWHYQCGSMEAGQENEKGIGLAPLKSDATGLVMLMRMDEGKGGTVYDASVNRNDGILTRMTPPSGLGKAKFKNGLRFDGRDDAVIPARLMPPGRAGNFTLSVWVKPEAARVSCPEATGGHEGTQGQRYVVYPTHGRRLGGEAVGVGISVGTNGVGVFEHTDGYMPCVLNLDRSIHDWTHVLVVYSEGVPALYLNGRFVRKGQRSGRAAYPGLSLGGENGAYGCFAGLMDEFSVYDRVLTPEQIHNLHKGAPHIEAGNEKSRGSGGQLERGLCVISKSVTVEWVNLGVGRVLAREQVETHAATWMGERSGGRRAVISIARGIRLGEGYARDDSRPHLSLVSRLNVTNVDLRIGAPEAPGVIELGIWGQPDGGGNRGCSSSILLRESSLEAHLSRLSLGVTRGRTGTSSATLDLAECESRISVEGDVRLGYCEDDLRGFSQGTLRLDKGRLVIGGNLLLSRSKGEEGLGCIGSLLLDDATVSVATNGRAATFYMGGATNPSGERWMQSYSWVKTTVKGRSGGIELGPKTTWKWASENPSHACITLVFAADPSAATVRSGGIYWALRWKGRHEAEVRKRMGGRQVVIDGSGLSSKYQKAVDVFHDASTDFTYVGCKVGTP